MGGKLFAGKAKPALAIDQRLRWRLLPFLLLMITLVLGGSLTYRIKNIRAQNIEIATEGARNMFRFIVLTRQWNADHGGVYVFGDEQNPVNPYLTEPERELELKDKRRLVQLNPAYLTRQLAELAEKDSELDLRLHITSLKPIRPENKADDWESQALLKFEQGAKETYSVINKDNVPYLRYMAPLLVKEACLKCHAAQGYKLGDIRGGISVSLRLLAIERNMREDLKAVVASHVLAFSLLVALTWWLVEMLARRWRALDDNIETLQATRHQLVETEKMASLGRLVAGFAHEINTPIGVAVGAITHGDETISQLKNLLRQDEVSERELLQQLDYLQESHSLAFSNLRRAADLVQRFKRTSIDRSSEIQREYQLAELINDVLIALHNALKHTSVQVSVVCPEHIKLYGTPGLLEQVLTNLITNSITHAFENGERAGHIIISASQTAERRLLIDYRDDGIGMSETIKSQAFEPFFTTRRDQGGSGLGLYVTYNIVTQQMAGTIQIVSPPEGGSRFLIDCPIETAPYQEDVHS